MMNLWARTGQKIAASLGERVNYGTSESSPSRRLIKQYFEQFALADLLPYQTYDPASGIFKNDASVGFVFETSPLVGCSEQMQREIAGMFQHTLPEGSSLQFLLWADPRMSGILDTWKLARNNTHEIFQTLAGRRVDFLETHVFAAPLTSSLRNFRCIVAYSQAGAVVGPIETQKLLALKDQIQTALKALGMPPLAWNGEDLLNTLDGIINFNHQTYPEGLKWNAYDSLNLQIPANTSYQMMPSGIVVNEGEALIRTYAVRREPDQWSLHAMGELIGDPLRDLLQIPCPFLIHYGIHVPFQEKTKTRVQSRESWVENQARSQIGKRIPLILDQASELEFVRHQLSRGERFVQTSFTVTLFSTPGQIAHDAQMLTNLFRSKRWQLSADSYIQLPQFLSTLPMNWGSGLHQDLFYLQRLKTTLSTEAANLLPLQGEWKGTSSHGTDGTSGMLLVGRRGQLFTWNPFENQTGNYNVAVVGKLGSGKSVFMQELVTTNLGQGGQIFVLDVGRSFERTAKLLGGTYIEFTVHRPLCINPFTSLPEDNAREAEDALSMLKPILSLMAAPKDGTNDLENSYLEQALRATWIKFGKNASITNVAEFLLKEKADVAQTLGQKLVSSRSPTSSTLATERRRLMWCLMRRGICSGANSPANLSRPPHAVSGNIEDH